jgi:molecular chaperone DnaK
VSASDQATGKAQTIKITASTNLSKEDVERMVRQAEINKAADQRRKDLIEARNQADNLAYTVEKTLRDLNGNVGADDRRAVEQLVAETRRAAEGEDVTAIRETMNRLQEAINRLSGTAYGQTGAGRNGDGFDRDAGRPDRRSGRDEDVVEGEFWTV